MAMKVRFYRELWDHPTTRYPAIYDNDVVEWEAYAVLAHAGEDLPGFDGSRMALGQIMPFERYLRVIYVPEPDTNSAFIFSLMSLRGAVLRACRARQRSRGRHHRGERQRIQIFEHEQERVQISEHGSRKRPWQDPDELAAEQRFPPGWNDDRARRVIAHYMRQSPEAQVAEDEAAAHASRDLGAPEAEQVNGVESQGA
jgi:hypothetical protein